jgi:hypothetical protein
VELNFLKLGILLGFAMQRGKNDEGDPFGSPSLWLAMRLET